MKKNFIFIVLASVCCWAMAQSEQTQLIVWAKNGTKVAYALNEKPQITFTQEDMVITVGNVEVNYDMENLARFTYVTNGNTAIRNLQTDESIFNFDGEQLIFPELKTNDIVSIYTIGGALVLRKEVSKEGKYGLSLSELIPGAYMVNVNGLTYKIVKK
ncbi:MAG: hypothetical protein IKJ92_01245 [Bacteroidaceae bacterium]|nr:hypothetical protein [Bacteroidaceae bacterium]